MLSAGVWLIEVFFIILCIKSWLDAFYNFNWSLSYPKDCFFILCFFLCYFLTNLPLSISFRTGIDGFESYFDAMSSSLCFAGNQRSRSKVLPKEIVFLAYRGVKQPSISGLNLLMKSPVLYWGFQTNLQVAVYLFLIASDPPNLFFVVLNPEFFRVSYCSIFIIVAVWFNLLSSPTSIEMPEVLVFSIESITFFFGEAWSEVSPVSFELG
mgnify:CR=1 FL=1